MIEQNMLWLNVVTRNKQADGLFVYGVRTTKIYCRPSCASKQPKQENVEFFQLPAAAEAAGFRACKRCRPHHVAITDPNLNLVQRMCDYIHDHITEPEHLTLEALGAEFNFAPGHLQDIFKSILNITPRQYAEVRRVQHFKSTLRETDTVTDAIYEAGFGSTSRVYERERLGMTPAQYQQKGQNVTMQFTVVESSLGRMLIAITERGLCAVGFYEDDKQAAAALHKEYPRATITRADDEMQIWARDLVDLVEGKRASLDVPFDIQATAFQWKVWDALRRIPRGETRSYSQIAEAIGDSKAVRAVATACANNRAAVIIPCHRVIGKNGAMTGYKWGIERKKRLLEMENAIQRELL
jgi:AraC family transcriptional regulator, regulatory protein of adaptative response / methylated-DNA-[protein]-cysteine methyltransferase